MNSPVRINVWRQNDLWAGYAIDQRRRRVASSARWRLGWRTPITFTWSDQPVEES